MVETIQRDPPARRFEGTDLDISHRCPITVDRDPHDKHTEVSVR